MASHKDDGTHVSAPGHVLLFGDHALNFGGPAIALAVEHRVHCRARLNSKFTVGGEELDGAKHPHTRAAVLQAWTDMDKPLAIEFDSLIPPGIGIGLQAAETVACLGAISMLHDHLIFEEIARNAFEVMQEVERAVTPLGISSSTHGRGIFLSCHALENPLWTFKEWSVHDLKMPDAALVLGYTGIPADDSEARAKVGRYYERNSFARDLMKDLCQTSAEGHKAVVKGDLEGTGRLMTQSHKLLVSLGAGHPMLEKLVQAAERNSFGAKLTGSGCGGSIIALTECPEKVVSDIIEAGGQAWKLELTERGLNLED